MSVWFASWLGLLSRLLAVGRRVLVTILAMVAGIFLAPASSRAAALPLKTYQIAYLPNVWAVPGASRIDDHGNVYGVNLTPQGLTTRTEFIIYRPTVDGTNPAGVQRIAGPVTGWMGQFPVVDVNNHGQFITSESSPGFDHRFLWNGSSYVELRDPRRPPSEFPIFSDGVIPTTLHNDGSVWGVAVGVAGTSDHGSILRWDAGGAAAVMYAFAENDPLGLGPPRQNEQGFYLRYDTDPVTRDLIGARLWNGQSAATGPVIPHPPSSVITFNDRSELAGLSAATGEIWLHLPAAAYGLTSGLHLLGETQPASYRGLKLSNAGQVLASDDDGLRVWSKGSWSRAQAIDSDGLPRTFFLSDANATGLLLAYVGGPPGTIQSARPAILAPAALDVVASVAPTNHLQIGDSFDLVLSVRNNLDVPLNQVGIQIPSMVLNGDLILDWVRAPSSLLSLAPGASGVIRYGFRTKGSGKSRIRFRVQGTNSVGPVSASTSLLTSPDVTVASPLRLTLTPDRDAVEVDDDFTVTAVIKNTSAAAVTALQVLPAPLAFAGTGDLALRSGPTPALASTLAAGGTQTVEYRFHATQAGFVRMRGSAQATLPNGLLTVSDVATSQVVRIGLFGDLLIKSGQQPVEDYQAPDVYQEVPSGPQVNTHSIAADGATAFHVALVNRGKLPQKFRLTSVATSEGRSAWEVRYFLAGQEVSSSITSLNGLELPELANEASVTVAATVRLTNSAVAQPLHVGFVVTSPSAPGVTLDAVEGVATFAKVRVRAIEVNQSVQDWLNSVPLVADKATRVRVFLENPDPTKPLEPIRGKLHGRLHGLELPGSPLPSDEPALSTVPGDAASVRGQLDGSLNFSLPGKWLKGSVTLEFEALNAKPEFVEPAEPNGQAADGIVAADFVEVPPLPVEFHLTAEEDENGLIHRSKMEDVVTLARIAGAELPVPSLAFQLGGLCQIRHRDLPDVTAFNKVYNQIRSFPDYLARFQARDCPLHQAVLPVIIHSDDSVSAGGGLAESVPGILSAARLSFVSNGGNGSSVHELGHCLGRHHPYPAATLDSTNPGAIPILIHRGTCGEVASTNASPYPYYYRPAGQSELRPGLGPMNQGEDPKVYGLDVGGVTDVNVVDPTDHFEFMSYCSDKRTWPGKPSYISILEAVRSRFGPGAASFQAAGVLPRAPQIVIRGAIDLQTLAVEVLPLRRIDGISTPADLEPSPLVLETLDTQGHVLEARNLRPAIDSEGTARCDLFQLILDRPELQALRIRYLDQVIWFKTASAHAPQVSLVSPPPGSSSSAEAITVAWDGADADGDPLDFFVEYTADDGLTWTALAGDCRETQCVIPRYLVKGGQDVRIRVEASDGFLSSRSALSAAVRLPDNPPFLLVVSPTNSAPFNGAQRLYFQAVAFDPEDGSLFGTNVQWRSSLDGALGSGLSFDRPVAELQAGRHELVVTATDRGGNQISVTNFFNVNTARPSVLYNLRATSSNSLAFDILTSAGTRNVVEASTDLRTWTPALTNVAQRAAETWQLPRPVENGRLFLRAWATAGSAPH